MSSDLGKSGAAALTAHYESDEEADHVGRRGFKAETSDCMTARRHTQTLKRRQGTLKGLTVFLLSIPLKAACACDLLSR